MSAEDEDFVTVEVALDTERWDAEVGWSKTVLGILHATAEAEKSRRLRGRLLAGIHSMPVDCPVCGAPVLLWSAALSEWACSDPSCSAAHGPGPGGGWPVDD